MSENNYSKSPKRGGFHIEHWQVIALILAVYDIVAINGAYFFALFLRFEFNFSHIPQHYLMSWAKFTPIYTVVCLIVFWLLKLYKSLWRFASYAELLRVIEASAITTAFHVLFITFVFERMPISYYMIGALLQFFLILGVRFSYRFMLMLSDRRGKNKNSVENVMLIGAGSAGQMILRDLHRAPGITEKIVCIIDDNPNKWNRDIDGVPIVGGRDDILRMADKYDIDIIYLAIPSATAEQRRDILNICKETGCELKNLPGMYQFVLGEVSVKALKDVAIEDLLGREVIHAEDDLAGVYNFLQGKVVLVTGGGGSIGSELCRQIAAHNPKQLIIFDIYENNAYDINLELREKYPTLNLITLIGSVRDSRRIFGVFEEYHPDVVYHAAAHKHVPLMEDSPNEAIKNNVIGTYKTAYAAMMNGCDRFVLISTDKAVNPTNIMGASKRLCEMIIQSFDHMIRQGRAEYISELFTHAEKVTGSAPVLSYSSNRFAAETIDEEKAAQKMAERKEMLKHVHTEFVAVRFGNVLGSNGSVVPIFKKQIEKGGPVTVTHPDITRYFMTIPEAVSLVLIAGTYAHGGEILVLDMGSPVKIDTLARNLIKLSGLKPDVDIKIEYTGLRPGEKLYEERLMAEEGLKKTSNELIHIGMPIAFDMENFLVNLHELMVRAYDNKKDIRDYVKALVSTYHPEKGA